MDKNFHHNPKLAPPIFQRYRSILIELLEAMSGAKKEDYEEIFNKKIFQLGSDGKHLTNLLQVIKSEPLLAFMALCRLKSLQRNAQIRLLTMMRIYWPKDLEVINRLSHVFFISELWIDDYGESPFAKDYLVSYEVIFTFIIQGNSTASEVLYSLASNKNNKVSKPNYLILEHILNRALKYSSKIISFLKPSNRGL